MIIIVEKALETSTLWPQLGSAVLGGALALAGSFGATKWAASLKTTQEDRHAKRVQANQALETLLALIDGYNSIANLKRHIDQMFKDANECGMSELDPWQKVMTIVGVPHEMEEIKADSISFLINAKKANIINKIHLAKNRIRSTFASTQTYNQLRSDFQVFIETHTEITEVGEGNRVSGTIDGAKGNIAQLREGQLNNILAQIIEHLEEDVIEVWETTKNFQAEAKQHFGDDFPDFELKIV